MISGNNARQASWSALLARVPKVELHVHVVGSLRAGTLAELAREAGLALPRAADQLYRYQNFYDFIEIFRLASQVLLRAEHFERALYEYVEDAHSRGALAHVEFFFNPSYHYAQGVTYRTQLDGLLSGIRAVKHDFGVSALLVPSIDREFGSDMAARVLDDVRSNRPDEVVGMGLDGPEDRGPPEAFAAIFAQIAAAGLHRTAHVCEDYAPTPASNYLACRDLLGCERFDHGYRLMSDPAVVAHARADGAIFTVCPKPSTRERDPIRQGAIRSMREAGLSVTLATDDPAMFDTDIADAYQRIFPDFDPAGLRAVCEAGIDACWLDASGKSNLRRSLDAALDGLAIADHPGRHSP